MKPKHLRKVSDNRIFAYTEMLAARSDMVPVWEPGEAPEPETFGLDVKPQDLDGDVKKVLREKDGIIKQLESQLTKVGEENMKLHDQVAELEKLLAEGGSEGSESTSEKDPPPLDNLTPDERMNILVQKCVEMFTRADPNDFTGNGVPRVERLEAWSGIPEVTGDERNDAWEKAKDLIEE